MIWCLLGIIFILMLIVGAILLVCFYIAFYASRKEPYEEYPVPEGEIYEPYREQTIAWIKEIDQMPYREVEVKSFDGLTLRGRFYKYADAAPIELMFPGYRGNARRDLCGAVHRCFALGHSALIVDQRACGFSEGHVISFGVNESRDCRTWIDFMVETFGRDVRIILTGISMGAATVLIAAGTDLPENVVGVLADCGYSSAEAIIKKVIKSMKLPVKVTYPFVRLAGKLFGGFDIATASPVHAMKKCKIPVLIAHGVEDAFVPCMMATENYENCSSVKKLLLVPGAGHCLCYPTDSETYIRELREFWTRASIYN